mmetsp:Transcript_22256/g.30354  ORF Transcript_22256/g.30354 Transcript_22256/m.30354 type:complete len:215 (-) Transcript_22256:224-868(-)
MELAGLSVRVGPRKKRKRLVVMGHETSLPAFCRVHDPFDVRAQVPVGEHDSFRYSSGARGVNYRGQIGGIHGGKFWVVVQFNRMPRFHEASPRVRVLLREPAAQHALYVPHGAHKAFDGFVYRFRVHHKYLKTRVFTHVPPIRFFLLFIHWNVDRSKTIARVCVNGPLEAITGDDAHPVRLHNPRVSQCAATRVHFHFHFGVGHKVEFSVPFDS